MYKLKGYMFIDDKKLPAETGYVIANWEEGHAFFKGIGAVINAEINHYIFTLIPQKEMK